MLKVIEREMEVSDPRLAAFLARGGPPPFYVLATCFAAAEAAVALTAMTVLTVSMAGAMVGLATIGTSLWVGSAYGSRGIRSSLGRGRSRF